MRAQTSDTLRADLIALGVRLGWVAADEKEGPALDKVRERLRHEGEGLLLLYDNAIDAVSLKPYLPVGGAARVLLTSNAHAWRGIAEPVEIRVWSKEVGADYLIARTGRAGERAVAEALSEALGGLPLAHEQASAYCERLELSLARYRERFEASPTRLLDADKDAPAQYYDRLTVAKTFSLAIDEAAKMHPAAERLIALAALLPPEPIPLYLFSEGALGIGEPLASQLADDGLDEAIGALRAFALVDRETIRDEREPSIVTETIRLHRLVRAVAAKRLQREAAEAARLVLLEAMAAVYPSTVFDDPSAWPRARRLDALALDLVAGPLDPPDRGHASTRYLLNLLGSYRHGVLAAYAEARRLFERALAIRGKALGPEHPSTATSLNNLALVLQDQGDLAGARPLHERALMIRERALGPEHPDTATSFNNLARLLRGQGNLAGARPLFERALAIYERALGPEHPHTAMSLHDLARLLQDGGDLAGAQPLFERALAIYEKVLGPLHPHTATSLNNLALVLQDQGDLAGARLLFERALQICEKALGSEHPNSNRASSNLASVRLSQGAPLEALSLSEAALAGQDKVLGPNHPWTKAAADVRAASLDALGRADEAAALRAKYGLGRGPAE